MICGVLVLVTFAAFARVFGFSFLALDDPQAVAQNALVGSGLTSAAVHWAFTQTQTFFWQPLTWLSHMLDCELFGLNPSAHHAVNLLFHAANTLLLFLLLRRLTNRLWRSATAAALFALHPLAMESVAWVAGRRDVLSSFFSLLAIAAYIRYAGRPASWGRYLLMLFASALAFAAKPMTASLPLLMLLLDAGPLGRWKGTSLRANVNLLREKAPLFAMAAAVVIVTISSIHSIMTALGMTALPLTSRISTSLAAIAIYAWKFVWPFSLAPIGSYSAPANWQINAGALLFFGILLIGAAARKRAPLLIAGWTWYVAALLPAFLYAQRATQFLADHLTYLPIIGLLVIAVWGIADLAARTKIRPQVMMAASAIAIAGLGARTFSETGHWKDTATLYEHAMWLASGDYATLQAVCADVARDKPVAGAVVHRYSELASADPLSPRKHYILGSLLYAEGLQKQAIAEFAEALRHNPNYASVRKIYGFALLATGNRERALSEFKDALRIAPEDPARPQLLAQFPEVDPRQFTPPPTSPPTVFTPENAIEAAAILLCAFTAFLVPKLGAPQFRHVEIWLFRAGRRPAFAIGLAAAAPMAIRLLLLPLYPTPQPEVADEFGHLLIADTLSSGRLANPSHPMWEHFESIYVLQHPTYTSIYPPAQGALLAVPKLFHLSPWIAVWASAGLMCAAVCWMLQAWLPPPWALLGALLAAVRFAIFGQWMNSYWGGALSAIGGALVLGALPRIIRSHRLLDALWLGFGIAVLSQSRPYEGFILAALAIVALLIWCVRSHVPWRVRTTHVLAPLAGVLALNLISIACYNKHVTGNPFELPYVLYQKLYGTPQSFFWQHPVPAPPNLSRYPDIAANYSWQLEHYLARSSWFTLAALTGEKAAAFWSFYLQPVFTVPLLFLPFVWKNRRLRLLLIALAVILCWVALYPFFFPHYVALLLGILLATVVQGIRYLRAWKWRGRRAGLFLSRALLAIALCTSVMDSTSSFFDPAWLQQRTERSRILDQLQRLGGTHLLLVRYGSQHSFHNSWIYNSAKIDTSPVVWARELDAASNQKLFEYFSGRRVWLLEFDEALGRLTPYPR